MEKRANGQPFLQLRDLVKFINEHRIKKEDIVAITTMEGMIFLIYYE